MNKHFYHPGKDIRFHINKFCNIANKQREMGRDVPTLDKTIDNTTMRLIGEEEIIACYQPTSSNNNAFKASG